MGIKYKLADTYYYTVDKPTDGNTKAGYLNIIKNYIRYYYHYAEIYKCRYLCLNILKFLECV